MIDTPLKPCPVPWCASQHVTTRHYDAKRRQHWVECFKCNFKTPQMPSKTNAIAAWNTRQPTQSDALREALAMAIVGMSRARGRLETIGICNEDNRIANALGRTCDHIRRAFFNPDLAALQEQSK
jgi:hypothetical protein